MKNIVFLLILTANFAFGQVKQKAMHTIVSSKGTKYSVGVDSKTPKSLKFYSNSNNKLDNAHPKVPLNVAQLGASFIDNGPEERKRRNLLLVKAFQESSRPMSNDTLFMTFKMKPSGQILEMNFFTSPFSKLSADDIELVERTLKEKYKLKTDFEKIKEMEFYWFSAPLYFAELKKLAQ